MIDRGHDLALTKQAALLGISRGSVYYQPVPVSAEDLALMRRMDELHRSSLSQVRGCCATYWLPRGARSAGVVSQC
jgi:hypothetical protein